MITTPYYRFVSDEESWIYSERGAYIPEGISGHDFEMGTGGRSIEIKVGGKSITCTTVGGLAAALGRTSHLIRCWERSGLIPPAPFLLPGEQNTRRRLYPVLLIAAIKEVAIREGFGQRRPSGVFLHQQQEIWLEWKSVMALLIPDPSGVTEVIKNEH